jgi:hypothetical protein
VEETRVLRVPTPSADFPVASDLQAFADIATILQASSRTDTGALTDASSLFDRETYVVNGTTKPSALTTGVIPNVTRTTLAGNQTITSAGTVLVNRDITGKVDIRAANVTLRNCTMDSLVCTDSACVNALIEDCTIAPRSESNTNGSAVTGHDFWLKRCLIEKHIDGVNVFNTSATQPYDSNVKIHHTLIRNLAWWTASAGGIVHPSDDFSHNDGIQHQGGWNTEIIGNLVEGKFARQYAHWQSTTYPTEPYSPITLNSLADGGPWYPLPDLTTGSESTGRYNTDSSSPKKTASLTCMLIGNNVGTSRYLTVSYNWFYGGDYGVNLGGFNQTGTDDLITAVGNRFDRTQGTQGTGGDNTYTFAGAGTGWTGYITQSGNIYEDNGNPINFRGD